MAESNRSTGTVKWFSAQKGFGFIAPDDGGEDLFVHQTSIRSDGFRTLSEGQVVEFVVDYGEDGRTKAVDVANLTRSPRRPGFGRGRGGGGGAAAGRGGRGRGGGYGGYGGGGYNTGTRGGRSSGGGGGECYNCGRLGHLARDCYQGSSGDGVDAGAGGGGGGGARRYGGGGRGYGGGGGGGRGCYNCGEEGHLARECPADQK